MTLRFTIPGRLPGLNEMIASARSNRFASAKQKREHTALCARQAKAAGLARVSGPVLVRIAWIEPDARRDVDNISAGQKYVMDGLVEAGVLPKDSRRWVQGLEHSFPAPDPKRPRIEIEIEELIERNSE